jgi:hypothetical protein
MGLDRLGYLGQLRSTSEVIVITSRAERVVASDGTTGSPDAFTVVAKCPSRSHQRIRSKEGANTGARREPS